jgi:hypothetical protein
MLPVTVWLLIWSGGATQEAAEAELAKLKAWPYLPRVVMATGYPRIEESAKVTGLKPGFFVVTMGACDEAGAKSLLEKVNGFTLPPKVKAYSRAITDGRSAECPRVVTADELVAKETEKHRAACEAGDAIGCYQLGLLLKAEARMEAWKKACALGHGPSCTSMGHDLSYYKAPLEETGAAYLRGCELGGDPRACQDAREFFQVRLKDPAKEAKAAEIWCTRDKNCATWGKLLAPKDPAGAAKLWIEDCQTRRPLDYWGEACLYAGEVLAKGTGVKRDAELAKTLWTRGCRELECDDCCLKIGEQPRPDGD